MKNRGIHPLFLITLLFSVFICGLFLGRLTPLHGNNLADPQLLKSDSSQQAISNGHQTVSSGRININTAGLDDLMLLPGIGPTLAERIIEHRETAGLFSTTEDLMLVKGIGKETYSKLSEFITVGG